MEAHTLNKKKILIAVAILVLIILIIISRFFTFSHEETIKYTTLKSSDEKFSIDMPSSISYKVNTKQNNDFTIDLYSTEDEMFLYATTIEKSRELDLYEVAKDDKSNYLKDKENIRDDSGIYESTINDYKAFEYNLVYFDTSYGKDFYCHVVWIETSNYIYILNFEVVNDNSNEYKDIFTNIKNSFVEL